MGLIKVVSPAQVGRYIDGRLSRIEQRGLTGQTALARLVRPGNIAAGFGVRGFDRPTGVASTAAACSTEIEGLAIIDSPRLPFKVAKGVVPGSLSNGRARVAKMKEQDPGCKLRIPTEAELLALNKLLGDQLEGTDYWIWTETEHEKYPGQFILRHLVSDDRSFFTPEGRSHDFAVRFVKDK